MTNEAQKPWTREITQEEWDAMWEGMPAGEQDAPQPRVFPGEIQAPQAGCE